MVISKTVHAEFLECIVLRKYRILGSILFHNRGNGSEVDNGIHIVRAEIDIKHVRYLKRHIFTDHSTLQGKINIEVFSKVQALCFSIRPGLQFRYKSTAVAVGPCEPKPVKKHIVIEFPVCEIRVFILAVIYHKAHPVSGPVHQQAYHIVP